MVPWDLASVCTCRQHLSLLLDSVVFVMSSNNPLPSDEPPFGVQNMSQHYQTSGVC